MSRARDAGSRMIAAVASAPPSRAQPGNDWTQAPPAAREDRQVEGHLDPPGPRVVEHVKDPVGLLEQLVRPRVHVRDVEDHAGAFCRLERLGD